MEIELKTLQIPLYIGFHLVSGLVNTIMSFTKYIGIQIQQKLHGLSPLLFIRAPFLEKGSMDILGKQHFLVPYFSKYRYAAWGMSVSYTHLDVYKRQSMARVAETMIKLSR